MTQKDYILEIPIQRPETKNILDYLKTQSHFDVEFKNNHFVFHPENPKTYFSLFKVADKNKIFDSAIQEIISVFGAISDADTCTACKDAVNEIKHLKREELGKDDFLKLAFLIDTYRYLIFLSKELAPYIFYKELIPLFLSLFPNGEIYATRKNVLLEKRFTALRGFHLIANETFMKRAGSGKDFPGFNTLQKFHTFSILNLDDFLKPLFLLFEPFIFGFSCQTAINPPKQNISRDEFTFIFLFGENINWLPVMQYVEKGYQKVMPDGYSGKKIDIIIPKDSPWGLENIYNPSFFGIVKRQTNNNLYFSSPEYFNLIEWWFDKLNHLFNYLLNPINFTKHNNKINPDRQFVTALTVDRIFKESSLVQTELRKNPVPFVSFNLSFAVLDKISGLISQGGINGNDAEIFKKLLKKSIITPKLREIFDTLPHPFDNYFRNQFKKDYTKLEKAVKDSIFLDIFSTSVKDKMNISGKNISFEEYIPDILRTIRNSHHGYIFNDMKKFDNLKFSTGEKLINVFPEITKFYLIWMLGKIDNLII
jgi:hypothetical protein